MKEACYMVKTNLMLFANNMKNSELGCQTERTGFHGKRQECCLSHKLLVPHRVSRLFSNQTIDNPHLNKLPKGSKFLLGTL